MKAAELKKVLENVPDNADVWIEYPRATGVRGAAEDISGGREEQHVIDTFSAGYSELKNRVVLWHNY